MSFLWVQSNMSDLNFTAFGQDYTNTRIIYYILRNREKKGKIVGNHILWTPAIMKGISYLQVQGLGCNNIAADLAQGLLELALQVLAAHHLGSLGHLPQTLFQPAEDTDQATLVDIGHFAGIVSILLE